MVVAFEHVDPDEEQTEAALLGDVLCGFEGRTGPVKAGPSGRGDENEQPRELERGVEVGAKAIGAIGEPFHTRKAPRAA